MSRDFRGAMSYTTMAKFTDLRVSRPLTFRVKSCPVLFYLYVEIYGIVIGKVINREKYLLLSAEVLFQ